MSDKSYSDLICEYSEIIHDKFLQNVYGIRSCGNGIEIDDKEDYILKIEIERMKNSCKPATTTCITNTYTTTTATGYVHNQPIAATTWTIDNALGFCPNVTTLDYNGLVINGEINYNEDCTVITIEFSEALTGKAILS